MLYRIYTENKNFDKVAQIVSEYFDGFTIITGVGFWQGLREHCLIVEVLTGRSPKHFDTIQAIAIKIKKVNKQESVMITEHAVASKMV